jgi:hypothetical protein
MGTINSRESTKGPSCSEACSRAPIILIPKSWIVVFCLAIYGLPFVLPLDPADWSNTKGFHCFLGPLLAAFPLFAPTTSYFNPIGALTLIAAWAANPVFWVGTWLLHKEHECWASILGLVSLLLGLLMLLPNVMGRGHFPPHIIYSCYYVWLVSFAMLAIGGFLTGLRWKFEPKASTE